MARVLPGSRGSGVPRAESCAAEKVSNVQDTLPNHLVYPRFCRPYSESGLPSIYVERKRGHSHFCMEAEYRCGLVGSGDGSEASVFGFLKLFSNLISKEWPAKGAHQAG